MVLDLDYGPENTTLTSVEHDDFIDYRNQYKISCEVKNARDTSTSPRDALTELRQTHSSILNVTSDAEESDDEDASQQSSVLFAELNEPPRLEEKPCCLGEHEAPKPLVACCNTNDPPLTTWFDRSTNNIRTATESFAENLCPANLSEPCTSFNKYVTSGHTALQHQMEMDILAILGCTESPTDDELETWTSPLLCPDYGNSINENVTKKESIPSRAQRIHRFRADNKIQIPVTLKRTNTIDNSMLNETTVSSEQTFHDALGSLFGLDESIPPIGKEFESTAFREEDGYDSDPEIKYRTQHEYSCEEPLVNDSLNISAISEEVTHGANDNEIKDTVQESLNYSWTLTWHATKEAMTAAGCAESEKKVFDPVCIQLWFERGHILHFGQTIIEPQFMWRRVLGKDLKTPYQMRLLNVCRVLPLGEVDRSKFPLARASHCFVLRLIHGEEFVFEASSEKERDLIVSRWKLVVARLAMLAVFEDIDAMSAEFFTPMVDPQTLTYE